MTQSNGRSVTLSLRADRALIRAQASSARYLLATVNAPRLPRREERLPVNVGLVLDRSGSMNGERKFELARQAVEQSLHLLRPEDHFSLVVYDNRVDVLMLRSAATREAKERALEALRMVEPRGGTDLCAGWMRGCEQVSELVGDDRISRVLLLTDGLANQGVTDRDALARHAHELRLRGIATSTFGVGADFDERLLRDMAHEGGGNFYFIERPEQIPDLLSSELGEALEVVMRRAALHVLLPPNADAELLNRYRQTRAVGDNELRVELGDLVSGQELSAVVRVQFPPGDAGEQTSVRVMLSGDTGLAARAEGVMQWTYDTHERNDQQPRDRVVDREVAKLYAARARSEATEANRRGEMDRARHLLESTARRIRHYSANDLVLNEVIAELHADVGHFADQVMSPMALKQALFAAESATKGRSEEGRAQRR